MFYEISAIAILVLGCFVLFRNNIFHSIIVSFFISVITATTLFVSGETLLALIIMSIDGLLKSCLFLLYMNKNLKYKPHVFKKPSVYYVFFSVTLCVILPSLILLYQKSVHRDSMIITVREVIDIDKNIVIVVSVLFLIIFFAIRNKKWNS